MILQVLSVALDASFLAGRVAREVALHVPGYVYVEDAVLDRMFGRLEDIDVVSVTAPSRSS